MNEIKEWEMKEPPMALILTSINTILAEWHNVKRVKWSTVNMGGAQECSPSFLAEYKELRYTNPKEVYLLGGYM